ncbi:hypothetical protein BCR41DRAFT_368975 [Lobosporangium transversale]|uniref:BHLH domain-containing protein n=1 Tax=Lobosporangium transversale TaxID=64571 RepID=A0A1Y2GUH0_9FUNG|nr:hypothetical protein BCR41DRAFT_368975 [Lobosporangium transversale]ORZ23868.1 hypothetical protein BCR41DRAFT_368975 [Lobosporangium transversale]|eukprot:XP_021883682.1 hypothetical protein BCR41DRAFT_368975 [Lobosporangium transversale]
MPSGMSLDAAAQQLALAQQHRDWIQQIASNPLLAPGGIINPHAMSQAMLQNPLLMAQANAISQAMNIEADGVDLGFDGQHEKAEENSMGLERGSSPLSTAQQLPQQQSQQQSARSPIPSQSSSNGVQSRSGKKPHHELLTEAEKKANHIASEQKRRQNIRIGFDSLVEIVPTLSDCHRSEAVILQKSVDYIHRLLNQKNELKSRVRELQAHLGDPLDDSGSEMDVEQSD